MARLRFRVERIHLDEEELVAGVDVMARNDTYKVIEQLIGKVELTESRRNGTEVCLYLAYAQVTDLFHKARKFAPIHVEHEHTREIHESLSFIVYGLMDRD